MYHISTKPDGDGYLSQVDDVANLYAWGLTPEQAQEGLKDVVDMTMDYHLEQIEKRRQMKNMIFGSSVVSEYAI